jgi:hypothetical protein
MKRTSRTRIASAAAVLLVALAAGGFALFNYVPGVAGNDLRFWVIGVWSGLRTEGRQTADDAPLRYVVPQRLGVNTFLEQEVDLEKRRRTLELARDAGFHWVRQQFPWADLEPRAKGRFVHPDFGISTWEKYDQIVALTEELGLELIVRLDTSPEWARPGNVHVQTPPDRLEDFGAYVEAVVARYRGRVRHYQIWNEPNLAVEWGNRPVDPAAAAELLKVAYQRAKGADPSAIILAPALAPTISEGPEALNELKFLEGMYDAGAGSYFDVGSVQAYGLRSGPDDRRLRDQDVNFSRPIRYREIMVAHGDAAKPVWASEIGWNVPPPGAAPPYTWGQVTEDQQARYTVRALERARQEWPWMGVLNVWYLRRPYEHELSDLLAGFRLLDPDFTPRPVYRAIRERFGSSGGR